ncbi:T9SS type A sorting domain-containing protein [bacterium]|nr:T9SS type A sorting domain-containing protein [bacterium]
MNLLQRNKLSIVIIIEVCFIIAFLASPVWGESHTHLFSNGIEAEIYTPQTIIDGMIERDEDGELLLTIEDGWKYSLVADPSDSSIVCKGDGRFYPHTEEDIVAALREVDLDGVRMDIRVEIYLLPFPRRGFLRSTACGSKIFLTPGVYKLMPQVSAFFITHELGHCFQNIYLPKANEEEWRDYLILRGVYGDPDYDCQSVHSNRPVEIFAEDFRYLFGGELSKYSGGIENPDLDSPENVDGLEEFFVSLVAGEGAQASLVPFDGAFSISNYPNPFNPSTTINVLLDRELASRNPVVDIGIYSVDGALVNNIFHRKVSDTDLRVEWSGETANGSSVVSGVYFYMIRAENYIKTGKMLLIR